VENRSGPAGALCYLFIVLISKRTGSSQQIVRFCAWASVILSWTAGPASRKLSYPIAHLRITRDQRVPGSNERAYIAAQAVIDRRALQASCKWFGARVIFKLSDYAEYFSHGNTSASS